MPYDSEKIRERTAMLKGEAHGSPSAVEYLLLQCNGLEREIWRLKEGVTIDDKDREISSLHIRVDQLHAQVRVLQDSLALKIERDLDVYGWAIVEENVTPDCYAIEQHAIDETWLTMMASPTRDGARAQVGHLKTRLPGTQFRIRPAKFIGEPL